MPNLILNAIKKSKERDLMLEGTNDFLSREKFNLVQEVPIEPQSSEWETINSRDVTSLKKVFNFQNMKHVRYFLDETLKESSRIFHHPRILVAGHTVEIELYTHDINNVSALDIDMSKFIDEIFGEIKVVLGT